ncbi:MAG TPA: hypothetical protein VNO30_00385 [Kofleriaceae bacterium]|nr:hypothetical protein [Kofleriaceae bacterium]
MNKHFAARLSALATATALSLAPTAARATKYSDDGWLQLVLSSSKSAEKTIAGNDFGIGYSAYFGLEGYNWDVAPNTITTTCSIYSVLAPLPELVVEGNCRDLPGTLLSSSATSGMTTYDGYPAMRTAITYEWDVPDAGAMAEVDGYFKVPATLFDEDLDLLKLTGTAVGKTYGSDTVSAGLYVLGAKIAGDSASLPATMRIAEKCVTLAEVEANYSLLGIPVTVSASSDGCIYVDASASWGSRKLSGSLTPGASVDATLKAGVGGDAGFASASAGVYGNLTIVDAKLPLSISSTVGTEGISITESAKLTMTGLDGEVGLYVEGCIFGICEEATKTLFDWTGMTYASTTIFSQTQTLSY